MAKGFNIKILKRINKILIKIYLKKYIEKSFTIRILLNIL